MWLRSRTIGPPYRYGVEVVIVLVVGLFGSVNVFVWASGVGAGVDSGDAVFIK